MALVYRFENENGEGPFTSVAAAAYDNNHSCRDPNHSSWNMRTPGDESGELYKMYLEGKITGVMLFAFASLYQLKKSFPSSKGRAAMARKGQKLVAYDIPEDKIYRGLEQVIFPKYLRKKLKPAKQFDLKTLKEITEL